MSLITMYYYHNTIIEWECVLLCIIITMSLYRICLYCVYTLLSQYHYRIGMCLIMYYYHYCIEWECVYYYHNTIIEWECVFTMFFNNNYKFIMLYEYMISEFIDARFLLCLIRKVILKQEIIA